MSLEGFRALPLMGILRGVRREEIAPLARAVIDAGLRTVEITMNTKDAPDLIRELIDRAEGALTVGAGTVLDLSDLKAAEQAGASFVVMPTLVRPVVEACAAQGMPAFPGALTPQEIYDAHRAGAAMVKVFPANLFGPRYFKDIRGPFADVPLLACGGVSVETIGAFFENGADGVSFGASIFRRDWIEAGAFQRVGDAVRALVAAWKRRD